MTLRPQLTIVFDNVPGRPDLTPLWGFAAVIRIGDRTLLFDTGSNGRVLLKNMAAIGLAPAAIDLIFLSHPHWDHLGGLDSLLELNERATVVVHQGFSTHRIADLRTLCGELAVVGAHSLEIAPGIYSTGLLAGEPPEHAMLLDVGGVTAAISGCAHPGMARIIAEARHVLGKPVGWAIGGFHMMDSDTATIADTIRALRDLGVTDVLPTHCTGSAGMAAFRAAYRECCHIGGVGREIALAR